MSKFKVGDKVLQGSYVGEWEVLAVKDDWCWIYREGFSNSGDLRHEDNLTAVPVWEPKVGGKAVWTASSFSDEQVVTVLAIDGTECWLRAGADYRFESYTDLLSEYK